MLDVPRGDSGSSTLADYLDGYRDTAATCASEARPATHPPASSDKRTGGPGKPAGGDDD
jgi:hypothetical protein